MKTQILRLDAHDDVVSARDKIGWNQTDRIVLVWPPQGQILHRPLDLVLLQRQSQSLGAQLALVTRDAEVGYNARNLGIPVFRSLRQAQRSHWRVSRRLPRLKDSSSMDEAMTTPRRMLKRPEAEADPFPRSIQLPIFALGLIAVLLLAAVIYPSAAITLHPRVQEQEINLSLQAVPQLASFQPEGSLQMRPIQVIVEGRDQIAATGSKLIPDQAASGWVQFTNLTDEQVLIPSGTVVVGQTEKPVRFNVVNSADLAAGTGQTVTTFVKAQEPGSQGNLSAQTITGVEGSLGVLVTVNNRMPTSGGKDRKVPAPTRADRERLRSRLLDSLHQSAVQELQNGISPGDVLILSSFKLAETREETYTPDNQEPGDQLELNMRLVFTAEKIAAEDVRSQVEQKLLEQLPAGYTTLPGSFVIAPLEDPKPETDGSMRLELVARQQVQAEINPEEAIRLVLGQTAAQAARRLAVVMPLSEEPQIRLEPAWWPRLPFLPFRVSIILQPELLP